MQPAYLTKNEPPQSQEEGLLVMPGKILILPTSDRAYDRTNSSECPPGQHNGKTRETLRNIEGLLEFITDPEKTVPIYPLLIPITGLPNTKKTELLVKAFELNVASQLKEEPAPKKNDASFSHHEFITGEDKIASTNEHASYAYGLQSGIEFNFCDVQLADFSTINYDAYKSCEKFEKYLEKFIKHLIMSCSGPSVIQTHANQNSSPEKHDIITHVRNIQKMLLHGVGFISMWDTLIDNKTIRPILQSFGRCFTRSVLWLFTNLDNYDPDTLHLPPVGTKTDPKALSWRSRIEYLLKECQLCKQSSYAYGKKKNQKVCSIFATYSISTTNNLQEKVENLKSECIEAARQMGVEELINFDIVLISKNAEAQPEQLQVKLRKALEQVESTRIPLSWLLLRGVLADWESFYIHYDDLVKIAKECKIPLHSANTEHNLDAFCDFFSSFGSIFDIRNVDKASRYIVTKPCNFLIHCDQLVNKLAENHEYGIVQMCKIKNVEDEVALEIMNSIGITVEVKPQNFFIPTLRNEDRKKFISEGSVQFVLSMNSPNIRKNTAILKTLIKTCPPFQIEIQPSETKWSNSILITMRGEDNPEIRILLSFQGDVTEIHIENIDEIKHTPDYLKMICKRLVHAFNTMVKEKEESGLQDIHYHFAVRCEQNEKSIIAYDTYHKRHILPNKNFCNQCKKKGLHAHPFVKSWNETLQEVDSDIPQHLKLDGDLFPQDISTLIAELSEYPIEAIKLLSKELDVNFDKENEHDENKVWLIMGMLLEWRKKLDKEDESLKKILARHLVAVDVAWKKRKVPNFGKLAQQIDMQVLTDRQKQLLQRQARDSEKFQE